MSTKPYYEQDGITIYHDDCRDVVSSLDLIGVALVFDPPYGIEHETNHTCDTTTADWMNQQIENDADTTVRDHMLAWFPISPWACFGSPKASVPNDIRGTLIWDKGPASGMGDLSFPWKRSYELIYIGGTGWIGSRDEGVIKGHHIVTRASMGRLHQHEKPVSLMCELIRKLPQDAIILDPTIGSGSTLVAAKLCAHKAIGIDVRESCCAMAAKRLAQRVLDFGTKESA